MNMVKILCEKNMNYDSVLRMMIRQSYNFEIDKHV